MMNPFSPACTAKQRAYQLSVTARTAAECTTSASRRAPLPRPRVHGNRRDVRMGCKRIKVRALHKYMLPHPSPLIEMPLLPLSYCCVWHDPLYLSCRNTVHQHNVPFIDERSQGCGGTRIIGKNIGRKIGSY